MNSILSFLPIDDNLKPFIPVYLEKLGITNQDSVMLDKIFETIVKLANSKNYKTVGDLIADKEIVADLGSLVESIKASSIVNHKSNASDVIDVTPAESNSSSMGARVKLFACPHCKKLSYI